MKLAVMPVRTMMLAMVMTTVVVMMAVTLFVVGVVSSFSFCELKWGVLVAVVEQQTPLMVLLVAVVAVVADQS